MDINLPKPNVLNEYLLIYGEEWVKEQYGISGDKIDALLYGRSLPTKKQQKKLKKGNLPETFNWTKYNDDIENIIKEIGSDIEFDDVSVIEDVALKYQEKKGVFIKTEMRDRFIWDSKSKVQLEKENKVYEIEESEKELTEEFIEELLESYIKIMSSLGHNAKRMVDSATTKTKEDGVQELFKRNFEVREVHNMEMTNKIIEQNYQRNRVGKSIEMFFEKREKETEKW